MPRIRKSVKVIDLIQLVNKLNESPFELFPFSSANRVGWNTMLENILKQTETYAGYVMLDGKDSSKIHYHTHPLLLPKPTLPRLGEDSKDE